MKPRCNLVWGPNEPLPKEVKKHKEQQKQHFLRRIWERYMIALQEKDVDKFRAFVIKGKALQLTPASCYDSDAPRSLWLLEMFGERVLVVFDHATRMLVTALPRTHLSLSFVKNQLFPNVQEEIRKVRKRSY